MTIHIVRHGRTEANASGLALGRSDPPLDPVGETQAEALARAVGPVDRVISSPLTRCRQTAARFGVEVEIDERLVELDYGEFDLVPLSEIPAEVWQQWRADPGFRPPGGESLQELAVRVGECLEELWVDDGAGGVQTTVVVTHVSPVKAALAWALGVSVDIAWRSYVAPASLTTIGRGAGAMPSLRLFNSVTHLD